MLSHRQYLPASTLQRQIEGWKDIENKITFVSNYFPWIWHPSTHLYPTQPYRFKMSRTASPSLKLMELCQIICLKSKWTKFYETADARESNPTWRSLLKTDVVGRSWEKGTAATAWSTPCPPPGFSSQNHFTPNYFLHLILIHNFVSFCSLKKIFT